MTDLNRQNQTVEGNVRGRQVTPEEVAYRDGYVHGRAREDRLYREELRLRQERQKAVANNQTTAGFFFGVLVIIVAGLLGGSIWAMNRSASETTGQPQNSEAVDPTDTPQSETTIIERTIERTQEVIPSPPQIDRDINITVPTPEQPASDQEASSPEGEASQSEAEASDSTQ